MMEFESNVFFLFSSFNFCSLIVDGTILWRIHKLFLRSHCDIAEQGDFLRDFAL